MSGGADGIVGMAFEANHFSHNAEAAATYVNVTCAALPNVQQEIIMAAVRVLSMLFIPLDMGLPTCRTIAAAVKLISLGCSNQTDFSWL